MKDWVGERTWEVRMLANVIGSFGYYEIGQVVHVDLQEAYTLIIKGLGLYVGSANVSAGITDFLKRTKK